MAIPIAIAGGIADARPQKAQSRTWPAVPSRPPCDQNKPAPGARNAGPSPRTVGTSDQGAPDAGRFAAARIR